MNGLKLALKKINRSQWLYSYMSAAHRLQSQRSPLMIISLRLIYCVFSMQMNNNCISNQFW